MRGGLASYGISVTGLRGLILIWLIIFSVNLSFVVSIRTIWFIGRGDYLVTAYLSAGYSDCGQSEIWVKRFDQSGRRRSCGDP